MNFQKPGWIEHDLIGDQIEHSLQHAKRKDKKFKTKKEFNPLIPLRKPDFKILNIL